MIPTRSELETIKASVNPYDGEAVFARLARGSVADITPKDDIIMRCHGLYRHRPQEDGVFMLRLKLPGGVITAEQLVVVAGVAERTGLGRVNLTTRQDIELHRLTLADLPAVFAEFTAVGLTTVGACGDQVRNVIACPVAGIDPQEVMDTTAVTEALNAAFFANPAFANLPRKFKIAVCGCARHCVPTEINDFGLVAVRNDAGALGFSLMVGGGLSARPASAVSLDAWIAPEEAVAVVTHAVEIFQAYGNRENRAKARMKHLIAERGVEWFRSELAKRFGRELPIEFAMAERSDLHGDHLGCHPQREEGLSYLGIPVAAGRLSTVQLRLLADIATTVGHGRLRMTHMQNLILPDIPTERVGEVAARLATGGLPVSETSWHGRLVACTGKEFCNKAIVHTKEVATRLANALDVALPHPAISLQISGCPNGCGQHAIADIGLQGSAIKTDSGMEERFDVWVGGGKTGDVPAFGQRILTRVHPDRLEEVIVGLLNRYKAEALPQETFSAFGQRILCEHVGAKLGAT